MKKYNQKDLEIAINEVALSYNIEPAVLEKDYWVTLILSIIYTHPKLKDVCYFKGGTALSKCYGAIQRFSEDIDITMNPILPNGESLNHFIHTLANDPHKHSTIVGGLNTNEKLLPNLKLTEWLSLEFKSILEEELKQCKGIEISTTFYSREGWEKVIKSINIKYPTTTPEDTSIIKSVQIEPGCLYETIEHNTKSIHSIIDASLGQSTDLINVEAITIARAIMDKLTIIHDTCNRQLNNVIKSKTDPSVKPFNFGKRNSRHLYDVYALYSNPEYQKYFNDTALLKEATQYKIKFWHSEGANYESIINGKINLTPSDYLRTQMQRDYESMGKYFVNTPPTLNTILNTIKKIENKLNHLLSK